MREIPSFDENNASLARSLVSGEGKERKRRSDVCEAWGHHYGFICVQAQSLSGRITRCSHLLDQSSKSFATCGSFCIFIRDWGKASNVSLLVWMLCFFEEVFLVRRMETVCLSSRFFCVVLVLFSLSQVGKAWCLSLYDWSRIWELCHSRRVAFLI